MPRRIEHGIEQGLFFGRWLMVPGYIGLVVMLGLVSVKIVQETAHAIPAFLDMKESDLILVALNVIDLSLTGNLILMVTFAGYENFVSKIAFNDHEDRPDWMTHIDFGKLKLKLLSSIVAISAIDLLKAFADIGAYDRSAIAWKLAIHLGFVVSGVILAYMDKITSQTGPTDS
jgi:uncharacterized protein (TIGR00645 family)